MNKLAPIIKDIAPYLAKYLTRVYTEHNVKQINKNLAQSRKHLKKIKKQIKWMWLIIIIVIIWNILLTFLVIFEKYFN